jgi:hypothetical protein
MLSIFSKQAPQSSTGDLMARYAQRARGLLGLTVVASAAIVLATMAAAPAEAATNQFSFPMVPSAKGQQCLPLARAHVTIKNVGPVEEMLVTLEKLPPNTGFDFFVIQGPNAPFGLSWYQGDIETDDEGRASQLFIGRFSQETFIVAPGVVGAPLVHNTDTNTNPVTAPVHTAHLGLWFNSPADAVKAGCDGDVTPFNGEHNAGIQVLSTRNFRIDRGPLLRIKP